MDISLLTPELASICETQFSQIGWDKPDGYFQRCYEQQNAGEIEMYVAHDDGRYVGHVKLAWEPDAPAHFCEAGIPEIQDLNVLPTYRNQGVGTALIRRCEERAAVEHTIIGIGVGLHPGYNNAQRLYSKLGYLLDGHGVHYNDKPVVMGESYRFDDDLIIYFTKTLNR